MAVKNILEKAIEVEKHSRDYYKGLMAKPIAGYAGDALEYVAREEQRHIIILQYYQRSLENGDSVEIPDSGQHIKIWSDFMKALDRIAVTLQENSDEITVVRKALELEERGMALYREARENSSDKMGRIIFSFLMKQETTHRDYFDRLLKQLLVMNGEPPEATQQ